MSSGGHGGGRQKPHEEEEHENHERWLVSYADMMTLLMVLFVVMFAISQVDQRKFAALKSGLAAGFGAQSVFDGGTGTLQDDGPANNDVSFSPDVPGQQASTQAVKAAVSAADIAKQQQQLKDAEKEASDFAALQKKITEALKKQNVNGTVKFTIDERGLVVTMITSSVVFAGDRAELLSGGQHILDAIGPTLRGTKNNIEVDGHTNQLPVPTKYYPSAWELSTARASTVVRYLVAKHHIASKRMMAAGFAGERPLYPVTDKRAPTLNRRVEIVVLSSLPADEKALLPAAAGNVAKKATTTATTTAKTTTTTTHTDSHAEAATSHSTTSHD